MAAPTGAGPTQRPSAPTSAVAATSTEIPGARLVYAVIGSLARTLHPYPDSASYTQAWIDAAALIWGGADGGGALLAFDWDALDYRPAMAEQLPRMASDGRTFTVTLRNDLKWSDGSSIGTDDFLFAFDQASREDNRYVQIDLVQNIASYRALDKQTLEITLKDARPRDLAFSIVNAIRPVPRRVWTGRSWTDSAANPEILRPSVVLGPFAVQDFVAAEHATFAPVPTYFVGKGSVSQVELLADQEPRQAYESLKSGRANWLHSLPPDQYPEAVANPNLTLKEWMAANAAYRTLEFNVSRPFLADKRVRQALSLATNRSDLISIAEYGLAEPQYSFIQPANLRWVNTAVDRYDYDMTRAHQLLLEAGYRSTAGRLVGKDGQPIQLQVVYPTSSSPRVRIAAYLQQQYTELGIAVDLKGLEFSAYTGQVLGRRDFDISLAAYGGGSVDPDLGPKAQLITNGQQNVTGYSNPQVDELFREAALEVDQTRRKRLYDQIQTLVNADVPSHFLYALKSVDVFASSVHGVTTHKGDRLDYNDALLRWSVDH